MLRHAMMPALVMLSLLPNPLAAQRPVSLQMGVGAHLPRGEFAQIAENGSGWGLGGGIQLVEYVGVYVGYSTLRFDSPEVGGDLRDSGFSGGISVVIPEVVRNFQPWIGGGVVLHRLDIGVSSNPGGRGDPGYGVGGGLLLPPLGAARIAPTVGYVRYTTPFPGREKLEVSYLSIGFSINFTS
jgi:hypothetical protein